ncbi:hypothetical protein GPA27_19465 [Aromatoleum toluolicum]|uniref:Uncharacterized protein n=1 Tax=Aromatoleum toluolicum TaxID=90060 RepID=A0ABX1NKH9_9RHOO|nr:hypothetical protein [Aromatoleum toluolicum]NMF99560.1 hypothetical protein [Aromatoleum toluolicum]
MPRVPTLDNFGVMPNQLPGVQVRPVAPRVDPGQQLAQFGGAVERAGAKVMQIEDDMQLQQDRAEAKDIDSRFTEGINDLQFNAQSGYLTTQQGKNAVDAYEDTMRTVEKLRNDAMSSTQNTRVRAMIGNVLAERAQSATATMSRHFAAENRKWQVQSSQDRADVTLRDAAANFDNPDVFTRSLGTAHEEVEAQGALLGWDDATKRLQREKYTESAFKMRYDAWRQVDPAAALADLQQNGRLLNPVTRDQIERELFAAAAPVLAVQINKAGGVGTLTAPGSTASTSPRGERNNNPGNLVRGETPWEGEVPGPDARFAAFATPEAGIRAMGKNLLAYQDKHGINTVEGIISRWAPASENDTAAYIRTVAGAIGVKPDAAIDLHDPATLQAVTKAVIRFENGRQPYTDQQIDAGLAAATGKAPLPSVPASSGASTAQPWRDPAVRTGNAVVDALPPDQRMHVLQLARSYDQEALQLARTSLGTRVQDAQSEYLTRGTAANPPTEAEFIRAYGQDEGITRYRALQDTATLGQRLQQIKTMPDADLARLLADATPTAGDGFAARQRNYEILQQGVTLVRKLRAEDPVQTAFENPGYGLEPLARFDGPEALTELRARGTAMARIARDYAAPPAVLTQREADQFRGYLGGMQAVDKARVLEQVTGAVGPAGMQAISAQLKDKDSTLAIAGVLASKRTTYGNSTARLYLEGKEMLAEKRAKIDTSAETGIRARIFTAIDGVYLSPQGRDAAADAAFAIYAKLKSEGDDDVERAVSLATGGVMEFNGAKIAKPYGWEDSRFRDALRTTLPAGLAAAGGEYVVGNQRVTAQEFARMLPGARLQTFGDGGYLVKAGNDVVRRADGSPFILQVGQ